jgi:hypothetical protein
VGATQKFTHFALDLGPRQAFIEAEAADQYYPPQD